MADKEIDKKSEQGISGFLKRNFGTGTEETYAEIYRRERERAEYRSDLSTGERITFGSLISLCTGVLGGLGGVVMEETVLSPDRGVDDHFVAQLEPQQPGSYIGLNYGYDTFVLSIGENGKPLIWQQNRDNELVLQENTGDALEDVVHAIHGIEHSLNIMASDGVEMERMANVVSFQDISEMHIEDGYIERQTSGAQAFSPNNQLTYIQTLETVLPHWQAAEQHLANDFYGFTNDERAQIKGHDYAQGRFTLGMVGVSLLLGFFSIAGAPQISAASNTLGRARRGRKQARALTKG